MPKYHESYKEYGAIPDWTQAEWNAPGDLKNKDAKRKWSGEIPPPAIGAKVTIYMNSFGTGTVKKYFEEHGWLGMLVEIDKPPKWWIEQNKRRGEPGNRLGHFFGVDLTPRKKEGG